MLLTPSATSPPSRPYHSPHGKRFNQINTSNQLKTIYPDAVVHESSVEDWERPPPAVTAGFSLAWAAHSAAYAAFVRRVLSYQLTYFPSSAARSCLQATASGGCGLRCLARRRTQRANGEHKERRAAELRLLVKFWDSALIISGAILTYSVLYAM